MTTIKARKVFLVAAILCVVEAFEFRNSDLNPNGLQGKKELELSASQKTAFEKFQAGVKSEVVFPPMMKEIYLVKFFRVNNFDVNMAMAGLRETIDWRKEKLMDSIATSDLSQGRKNFEADTDSIDVQGRPILYMNVGKYGLATAIAKKEKKLWTRTFYQLFDEAATKAVETYEGGIYKNAQYDMVLNYDKWTSEEGACGECVAVATGLALELDTHWPGFLHRIVLLNVADDVKFFLDIVRNVMSKETNGKLNVFDRKKAVWCAEVPKLFEHKKLKSEC